jgi:hypothetical protein
VVRTATPLQRRKQQLLQQQQRRRPLQGAGRARHMEHGVQVALLQPVLLQCPLSLRQRLSLQQQRLAAM